MNQTMIVRGARTGTLDTGPASVASAAIARPLRPRQAHASPEPALR